MMVERMSGRAITMGRASEARPGLGETVLGLVREVDLDGVIARDHAFFAAFMTRLHRALDDAFEGRHAHALHEVHKSLYCLYEQNFATPANPQAANQFHPFLLRVRNDIERAWERFELRRSRVKESEIPGDATAFSRFFKERCAQH